MESWFVFVATQKILLSILGIALENDLAVNIEM